MDPTRRDEIRTLHRLMTTAQTIAATTAPGTAARVVANRWADEAEAAWRQAYGPLTEAEREAVLG